MHTGGIALVLGTRPEIIKLAALVRMLGDDAWLVHTGQHYDDRLSGVFLTELGITAPIARLDGVGGADRAGQLARIIQQADAIFRERRPDCVIVQGDTNSTLGGALAAQNQGIPVLHVEAGLRSWDRGMPEEINRCLVSVLADLHCAPTLRAAQHLHDCGIPDNRIEVTGNPVVEATRAALPDDAARRQILHRFRLHPDAFVLATVHRPANTDDTERLAAILTDLASLPLPVVLPLHPRTRARIDAAGLTSHLVQLRPLPPLGYRDFLGLASQARLLVSDSGGIQEECTVIKRPLLVVRDNTERPEAIDAGFARMASPGHDLREEANLLISDPLILHDLSLRPSPFGDGHASRRIADLARHLIRPKTPGQQASLAR